MSESLLLLAPLRIEQLAVGSHQGVRVLRTGMGPEHARLAAAAARASAAPAIAIAGLCAGISPELRAGDVICATELRPDDGEPIAVPGSALLAAALSRRGLRVHVGALDCAARIEGPQERRARGGGALGLDMESAWLAGGARGRPLVVLRVVVDEADRRLLDPRIALAGLRSLGSLRRASAALVEWAAAVGPRRLVLPEPRSFCAGVERAIEVVELALARYGTPVYVRRQIVHNEHVVAELERRGTVFVEELDEVPEGATVVFSAHGVSPTVRREASRRGLVVIDATCPLVAKVHGEARRFAADGRTIFLIGHRSHEEIEGTLGEAPEAIRVVEDIDAAARVEARDPERVAYLTQTTLAVEETEAIVEVLRSRYPALRGPESQDICYATANRQAAVRESARDADLVLVAGSRNSSNSRRLVEVARHQGARAHLVEDETELDLAWLRGASRIVITAGASAPEWIVTRLVAALGTLGAVEIQERTTAVESLRFRLPRELTRA